MSLASLIYKTCGRNVHGLEYMKDEFPEQNPNETTRLNCLQGAKEVCLPCFEIGEQDGDFSEMSKSLAAPEFLLSMREKFEAARMKAMRSIKGNKGKGQRQLLRLNPKLRRTKTRRKLVRKKRKAQIKDFLVEVRARAAQGYSTRQLMRSLIPDIGTELKIPDSEVTAAVREHEVVDLLI